MEKSQVKNKKNWITKIDRDTDQLPGHSLEYLVPSKFAQASSYYYRQKIKRFLDPPEFGVKKGHFRVIFSQISPTPITS